MSCPQRLSVVTLAWMAMPVIDYTLGNTILLTSNADALVGILANQGISPDITLDPDTFVGRLFAIMTGSTNTLVLDQNVDIISLPQKVPETVTAPTLKAIGLQDTKEMIILEPETLELPALLSRKDFLARLNDHSHKYMVNGRQQTSEQGQSRNTMKKEGTNK